jgi:hypothetical protein
LGRIFTEAKRRTALKSLRPYVDEYRLKIDGVCLWAPYYVQAGERLRGVPAPFRGKGTPGQMVGAFKAYLGRSSQRIASADDAYRIMRQIGLGVDCSGFVYQVLDRYLTVARGYPGLRHHLVVHQDEIEEALSHHPERAQELPVDPATRTVLLDGTCRIWKKNPRMITHVRRLCDPLTSVRIETAAAWRAGDMIALSGEYGDHVAIVVERTAHTVVYAESRDRPDGMGGVGYGVMRLLDLSQGLEAQEWPDREFYHPENGQDGVWRLKVLNY